LIFRNGLFENGVVISSLVSGIHPSPASCTQEITHLLERAGGPIARATKYRILSADGSSWSEIIPLLEADGFKVIAVQNPLTSLQDDVSAVKRALDRAGGPVILVGHSWGGVVITAAGVDERVKGLVYVAALAPDAGETGAQLSAKFDPAPIFKHIAVVDGYIWLNRDAIPHFAGDLSKSQQDLIYATQGPANAALFEAKVDVPAWKNKPSWYVVALEDGTINTEQERFMAKRMGATTIEVDSSHVPMISRPDAVVDIIKQASEASTR
jgi:pimeloyl-ACP methyl ester carboxylesterase